ncbi:hypothetical protein [Psychrobacter sp. 78a-MNA-CIBAN-0178]|uniref:hypothetical protein n=1 Tax=Psychrobacter sp. 78a-MNA-CIBAN-0178 TaxID=3140450 RepID=UPI00333129EF
MQVLGKVDVFRSNRISGWVFEKGNEESVELVLKHNDKVIAKTVADLLRPDLKEKGLHPTGECGFVFENFNIDESIDIFNLRVEQLSTSTVIEPTPVVKASLNKLLLDSYVNQEKSSKHSSKKCYLHVGMHKTGSTSIQASLSRHQFNSSKSYLKAVSENHSIPFYSIFTENPTDYHIHRRSSRNYYDCLAFNYEAITIIDDFISSSSNDVIISGEDISVLPNNSLEKLKIFLNGYFDVIKVIIYIRPPHSYISSHFQEIIKNGASGNKFDNLSSGNLYPNYQNIIGKFDRVFGQSEVMVRLFDKESLIGRDIVTDFVSAIGLKESVQSLSSNQSLSLEELSVCYVFNNYYIRNQVMSQDINDKLLNLINLIKPLAKNKFEISKDLTREVIERNIQDVKWVSHRANINIQKLILLSEDNENIVSSAEQLEEIGWKQIKYLMSNFENVECKGERENLLNKLVNNYL